MFKELQSDLNELKSQKASLKASIDEDKKNPRKKNSRFSTTFKSIAFTKLG